jgi:hypothetical protein
VEATLFRFFNPTARALENVSDARLITDEPLLRAGSDCGGGSIGVLHQPCFDTLSLSHFASGRPGPHDEPNPARLVARPAARVERRHFDLFSNVRAVLRPWRARVNQRDALRILAGPPLGSTEAWCASASRLWNRAGRRELIEVKWMTITGAGRRLSRANQVASKAFAFNDEN